MRHRSAFQPLTCSNHLWGLLVLTLILMISLPGTILAQDQTREHTVRQGETLYSISRMYDITVAEIREWNNLQDDNLRTGMTLRIAPPQRNAVTHTVSQGETLFAISRRYDVTIAELTQWNDLRNNVLSPGQDLLIYTDDADREPTAPEPPAATRQVEDVPRESIVSPSRPSRSNTYYTVRSGDFLNRIASEHGMSTQELRHLNNLEDDVIRVGQQLIVRQARSTPVVEEGSDESTPQGRFVRYRVTSGESLSRILNRFQMSSDELQALNPGEDLGSLRSGQQITVLLPPSRTFSNPYSEGGGMQDLGDIQATPYRDEEIASPTTSGELYNPNQLTAAHANMALGSIIFVENPANGRGVFVKVNDRTRSEGIRLSGKAFSLLGFRAGESGSVRIYQQD